jgi:hypothetical protein
MYHFMFGFLGASIPDAAAPSVVSVALPEATCASVFSASCIFVFTEFSRLQRLAVCEVAQQLIYALSNQRVHRPEIRAEQKHSNNDYCGSGLHFLEGRRSHLFHFGPNIVVEAPGPLRPRFNPGTQAFLVANLNCCCLRHVLPCSLSSALRPQIGGAHRQAPNSGRGGGIRTPKSGFGDRQFSR